MTTATVTTIPAPRLSEVALARTPLRRHHSGIAAPRRQALPKAPRIVAACRCLIPTDEGQACAADPWDRPHCTDCHNEHALNCAACGDADADTYDGSWDN